VSETRRAGDADYQANAFWSSVASFAAMRAISVRAASRESPPSALAFFLPDDALMRTERVSDESPLNCSRKSAGSRPYHFIAVSAAALYDTVPSRTLRLPKCYPSHSLWSPKGFENCGNLLHISAGQRNGSGNGSAILAFFELGSH